MKSYRIGSRSLAVLVGTVGLLSTGSLQSQKSAGDYWPMKTGSTWQFQANFAGRTMEQSIRVNSVSNSVATLTYQSAGRETQVEKYLIKPGSVSRMAAGAGGIGVITPPLPIIRYPMKQGDHWTWKGTILVQGKELPGSATLTVSAPTTVKIKAGSFKATRVHMVLTLNQKGASMTLPNDYWFAPGVGLVQQSANLMGTEIKGELTSYQLKK